MLETDYIFQLGQLEQFLEDKTFTLTPQFLTTERPDRAAECLIEGKVVILMHGSPFALVCPVTISEFFTTVEDKYVRFPFSNFMKVIRLIAILSSFLLPVSYFMYSLPIVFPNPFRCQGSDYFHFLVFMI